MLSVNLNNKIFSKKMSTVHVIDVEEELIEGLRQGVRKFQEAFYKKYFPIMFPTAIRYGSSKEDAHEIINTAFFKVFKSINKYQTQNFGGWVRTIVQRTAIDHCRKFKFNVPQTVEILEIDERSYNLALSDLHVEDILQLLKKLPDATRTVFNLFIFEELTHDEIAKKLGISNGTSKWHVSNARKLLLELTKSL